jgi:cell wall-associated NlpC family hydrolase
MQRWMAHVARYQAHMQNVFRNHEERMAMAEAHQDNAMAADRAIESGNVVRAAEAFRGTPYVMGGTSRSGFDCSGFTRFILGRSAGISLPRTAEEQFYIGRPVAKGDLEAGDLVFFRDTYRDGISHVGMYVGDGRFVHACNPSKGVTVSSLSEQYYINHWAGARRVLKVRSVGGDI